MHALQFGIRMTQEICRSFAHLSWRITSLSQCFRYHHFHMHRQPFVVCKHKSIISSPLIFCHIRFHSPRRLHIPNSHAVNLVWIEYIYCIYWKSINGRWPFSSSRSPASALFFTRSQYSHPASHVNSATFTVHIAKSQILFFSHRVYDPRGLSKCMPICADADSSFVNAKSYLCSDKSTGFQASRLTPPPPSLLYHAHSQLGLTPFDPLGLEPLASQSQP